METVFAMVRKWGNSKGVVLPKSLKLEEGEEIILNVQKTKGFAKGIDLFGKLKTGTKNLHEDLLQIDSELEP